jgi:hypothetical protein
MFNFSKKPKKLNITQVDKDWVETNINWLIEVGGLTQIKQSQLTLDELHFPHTFGTEAFIPENYIRDCSRKLGLGYVELNIEYETDIRDLTNMPWEVQGDQHDVIVNQTDNGYTIVIANYLKTHPKTLVYHITKQLLKIRMKLNDWNFETGADSELFVVISSVYFHFGLIMAMNSSDHGITYDGTWEMKWERPPEIPDVVMAYSLAYYSTKLAESNPEWTSNLSNNLKKFYFEGMELLKH